LAVILLLAGLTLYRLSPRMTNSFPHARRFTIAGVDGGSYSVEIYWDDYVPGPNV